MPIDQQDLEARVAVCTPHDRVRGIMFNEVLRVVSSRVGPDALARCQALLPQTQYRELVPYPIVDLLKLMYAVGAELEPSVGSFQAGLRACGAATVSGFAKTTSGSLFFGVVALAGPMQAMRGAPAGYASVVTYGQRSFESLGDSRCVIRMTGDMMPLAYHEGVFEEVFRVIGYDVRIAASAEALVSTRYEMTWTKRAAAPA